MVLHWGALNAARRQEGENSKQQYSAAHGCQGPLAGRGLMVTDFLDDLNREARCFLGRLETGMSRQSDKAKLSPGTGTKSQQKRIGLGPGAGNGSKGLIRATSNLERRDCQDTTLGFERAEE